MVSGSARNADFTVQSVGREGNGRRHQPAPARETTSISPFA
jgi:hypothetical protein